MGGVHYADTPTYCLRFTPRTSTGCCGRPAASSLQRGGTPRRCPFRALGMGDRRYFVGKNAEDRRRPALSTLYRHGLGAVARIIGARLPRPRASPRLAAGRRRLVAERDGRQSVDFATGAAASSGRAANARFRAVPGSRSTVAAKHARSFRPPRRMVVEVPPGVRSCGWSFHDPVLLRGGAQRACRAPRPAPGVARRRLCGTDARGDTTRAVPAPASRSQSPSANIAPRNMTRSSPAVAGAVLLLGGGPDRAWLDSWERMLQRGLALACASS